MKKFVQTLFLLALTPVAAIGQTISSQGYVTVDIIPVENTQVRLLATLSYTDASYDTLDVGMTGPDGSYFLSGDLLEGSTNPFVETDACPGLQFPISQTTNDTINCASAGSQLGLYIGAYPIDYNNVTWYFMNNYSSNVESYHWYIEGVNYSTPTVTHIFDTPGPQTAILFVSLTEGGGDSTAITIIAGSGSPYNCEALFFPLQDTLSDGYVYFVNSSLGSNLTYLWDFGDGTTSSEPYPTHFYDDAEVEYTICLTINGDECSEEYCATLSGALDGSEILGSGKPAGTLSDDDGFTFVVVPVSGMISGQNEIENQAPISVYPNPSTGTVTLEMNLDKGGNGRMKITDITGKVVLERNIATVNGLNVVSINMNDLTDGVYLIQYIGKQNSKVQKVVLQR